MRCRSYWMRIRDQPRAATIRTPTGITARRHARPVYARLGILPETAAGVNAATELAPGPRA